VPSLEVLLGTIEVRRALRLEVLFIATHWRARTARGGAAMTRPSSPTAPPPDPADLPFLLDAADLAVLLRTTRKAVYGLIERGQVPGVIRIGRRVLVRRDVLLEWLHRSCASPPRK
jgi:excisionase family DNA binding protein